MKESFEIPGDLVKTTAESEKPLYYARPKRDRSITAIPEILWNAQNHKNSENDENKVEAIPPDIQSFDHISEETLEAKIFELYALAEEYALKPANSIAVERSKNINDLASIKNTDDQKFLEDMALLFEEEDKDDEPVLKDGNQADEALESAIVVHREHIKGKILELMTDSALRSRYLAEISGERSIRKAPQTKEKLQEILRLRAIENRLKEEQRNLRVGEFLVREENEGKKRAKSVGLTPQALRNLERGISIAKDKEIEQTTKLNTAERGLLATEYLLQRKSELEEKGFVLSPSRERLISEIIELTAQGYRIFLGGPTGTGKTALALFALKEMTGGSYSWVTWTGETGVRDLFGSPKLTTNKDGQVESGMTKGPVTKGVIGEKSGVLHEEMTAGQTGVQMSMKTLWSAKAGDQINLPGFNGTEFTKSELIEIATGNLKGKRHQEREAMDPAVAREFKALEVSFIPSEEMRDYLILPMLIDRTGVMPLNRQEIEMINQFCKAAELSQFSYLEEIPKEVQQSDLYKIISPSGELVSLTSVFLDTGTVKDLFSGWRASGKSLEMYLQSGLQRFIEQNPHFKENKAEQEIMKNILRAYGFNLNAEDSNGFFTTTQQADIRNQSYLTPSNLGFLIPGTPPSEEDEFKSESEEKDRLGAEGAKEKVEADKVLAKTDEEVRALKASLRKAKKEVLGESFEPVITAQYKYKDEKGKETVENIEIDFEKKLDQALKFYKEHSMAVPADFTEQVKDIWEENRDEMQKQVEKFGFDEILIIPANLKLTDAFDKELTKGYKKKDGSVGEPTYWGEKKEDIVSDSRSSKDRIILVHKNKAKDLYDTPETLPILKETLGKKGGEFKPEEGMTIEEYFVLQRQFYEEFGVYLDEKGATWLPGSKVGSGVVHAYFDPDIGQVYVDADDPGYSYPDIGCRPSRCFSKK